MSGPLISLSTYPIRAGRITQALSGLRMIAAFVEEHEPRVVRFHFFLDAARSQTICLQQHPDAASMASHLAMIAAPVAEAGEWLDLRRKSYTTFGIPPREMVEHWEASGTDRTTYPDHVAGFTRIARAQHPPRPTTNEGAGIDTPFVSIASYPIKDGRLDDASQDLCSIAAFVQDQEPRVLGFHYYLDAKRARAVCIQIHPDPDSMAQHMATIADHLATAGEWLDLPRMQHTTLGAPPRALTDDSDAFGTAREEYPVHVAGFERIEVTRP